MSRFTSNVRLTALLAALAVPVLPCAAAEPTHDASPPHTQPTTGQASASVPKIGVEEFDKVRRAPDVVVLDVRTPQEFAAGHVAGAVNLPVAGPGAESFDEKAKALDKDKHYVVHCAKGGRSAIAASKLEKLGFPKLSDFTGGMTAWEKAGKPVERGDGKGEK